MSRLAFVGLGAMGSRLARRLLAAGHQVIGWNRTPGKARDLVAQGLTLAPSPRAAAESAEAVFTMVTDDAALRAVTLGPEGVVAGLGAGAVLVEMSTVSPVVVRELEAPVSARGASLLDVPVSGSTITVEQGYRIADQIHSSGRAIVWSGEREPAELYWEQLNSAGLTMAPLEQS